MSCEACACRAAKIEELIAKNAEHRAEMKERLSKAEGWLNQLKTEKTAALLQIQELQKALMCNCPICHYGKRCSEVLAVTGKYTEKR